MSDAPRQGLDPHSAPHAEKLSTLFVFFILFTGPAAWLIQLCLSVPMLSWPCFPNADRFTAPLPGYGWTRGGALVVLGLCLIASLAAGLSARRKYQEVSDEKEGSHGELIEVGHGRTRFTAMWGMILSFGFALASLLTFVAFTMVPRCAS